jgi:flagellar hook-basal body complex protein FliE
MDEERQKKLLLVKILVASLAVVIFLFWFLNLKNVFEMNKLRAEGSPETAKLSELKKEISSSLNDVTEKLKNQEQQAQLKEDVNGLLNGVMEEVNKTASSSEATSTEMIVNATSTVATSSPADEMTSSTPSNKVNNNCPSYIDCMPTIGAAKSCQVPAGCEGITQIAY